MSEVAPADQRRGSSWVFAEASSSTGTPRPATLRASRCCVGLPWLADVTVLRREVDGTFEGAEHRTVGPSAHPREVVALLVAAAADPRSTTTLVASLIAAAAAIAATVVGAVNAAKSRARDDRQQWWTRFVWAIDRATSDEVEQSELGLTVLLDLIRTPWASKEDNETALAVADLIAARARPQARRDRRRTR